jgi:hypothetical protein
VIGSFEDFEDVDLDEVTGRLAALRQPSEQPVAIFPVVRQAQLMGSEDAELQAYVRIGISATDTFRRFGAPCWGFSHVD